VENFQLIEDNIFSKTQGYVQKYDVIREGKRNEQLYEVTVRAVVKMTDLKNDLEGIATLMRRKNTPRMMVMIQEKNIGEAPGFLHYFEADMNTAETAIMDAFMPKGFKFIDQATVKRNLKQEQAAAILEGDGIVPVRARVIPDRAPHIIVIATDAPLSSRQLTRLAKRAVLGLAKAGSFISNGSGDFVIAFSTHPSLMVQHEPKSLKREIDLVYDFHMSPLFLAVVEATQEAVYNSLLKATEVKGKDGHTLEAVPVDKVVAICEKYGVLNWYQKLPPWGKK